MIRTAITVMILTSEFEEAISASIKPTKTLAAKKGIENVVLKRFMKNSQLVVKLCQEIFLSFTSERSMYFSLFPVISLIQL